MGAAGARLLAMDQARRQRNVAGFSLGYFVLTTVGAILVHMVFDPGVPYWRDPVTLSAHGVGVSCLLAFVWARQGRLAAASNLLVGALFVAVWTAVLGALQLPYGSAITIYLCLAPLFAGFLSTPNVAAAAGIANVGGLAAMGLIGMVPATVAADVGILTAAVAFIGTVNAVGRVQDRATIAQQARQVMERAGELESVIEASAVATYVLDGQARIRFANRAAREETGVRVGDVLTGALAPALQDALASLLTDSDQGRPASLEVKSQGRQWELAMRPMEGGRRHLLTVADTTERLAREERRQMAFEHRLELQKLSDMNRFKSNLLRSASHELNTPLTPIRLQMELLKSPTRGPLNAAQLRSLDIIDRSARKLSGLIQDIMDVARLEEGRLDLLVSQVAMDALLEDQARLVEGLAAQGGIEVALDIPEPVWVDGDAHRLEQVVGHLLDNAVRFSDEGGRVVVSLQRVDGQVRVSVRDAGIGVPDEMRPQLFQPFAQFEGHRGRAGTGLGLYISKGIVEAHGGAIGYQALEPGSLFWFTLPLGNE